MNIPHSCEVQSNLQMLGISVRKALMVPGEEILSHTSETLTNAYNNWRRISESHLFPTSPFAAVGNGKTLV